MSGGFCPITNLDIPGTPEKTLTRLADHNQVIPGNDQNTSPTNQKTTGSKLGRTS